MARRLLLRMPIVAAVAIAVAAGAPPADGRPVLAGASRSADLGVWDYSAGAHGPEHWAELDPAYRVCGSGQRQSPIDIPAEVPPPIHNMTVDRIVTLPRAFALVPHAGKVNMATTCEVFGTCGTLEWDDETYFFDNLHFHEASEHRRAGKPLAMEAHLVMATAPQPTPAAAQPTPAAAAGEAAPNTTDDDWRARDGPGDAPPRKLAVLAVFLHPGQANVVLDEVLDGLEGHAPVGVENMWDNLLVPGSGFCSWKGSLTTPPCTEGVTWLVQGAEVAASRSQLARFARDIHATRRGVNRPVQKMNGRELRCFGP